MFQEKLTSNYTLINVPLIVYLSIFDVIFPVFVSKAQHIVHNTPILICFLANGDGCIIIEAL